MKFVLKTSFLSAKLSAMKFLRMKEVFFAKHPNPDNFCPEDGGEYGRMDPIYTLTMDVHAGKYAQAEERIMDFRSRGMSSGCCRSSSTNGTKDAYDFFLDWCQKYK